jgi:quinol-cytochrome oxidoreductase complex cytochrome b subunit
MSLLEKIRNDIVESQVWKAIFRHGYEDTPRNRVMMVTANVFLHLHPAKVRRHAVRMRFTWCMGGLTFLMFLITTITGIYLMFYYRPVAEYAYADMKYLEFDMPFGMLMRNMHRWAAHGMVISVFLHMCRVFYTGSYKPPREFNWVVGVILLLLTLLLSFTGYLLPWDQLAIWAITVGSNMARATPFLGYEGPGNQLLTIDGIDMITNASDARFGLLGARFVGEETLNRFYVLHCVAIPLAVSLLLAIHFWRVRKDGGISGPL